MENFDDLKLGCSIPEIARPAVAFSSIIAQSQLEVDRVAIEDEDAEPPVLPSVLGEVGKRLEALMIPSAMDNLAPLNGWNVLGNDRYQDCVAVTWANMRRITTSRLIGRETYPGMDQVMQLYSTQNPELNPRDSMISQDLFDHLIRDGGPDGVHAIAYARIEQKDFGMIPQALALFGCLWVELLVYQENREFDDKVPWPFKYSHTHQGQHAVLAGGYSADGGLSIVTWGQIAQLTPKYVKKAVGSVYVVVWPEHLSSRRFTRGISVERLRAEYERLHHEPLPDLPLKLNSIIFTQEKEGKHYLYIYRIQPPETTLSQEVTEPYKAKPTLRVTPITKVNFGKARLMMDNDDLYLVEVEKTSSNRVEVRQVLAPDYYDFDLERTIVTAYQRQINQHGTFFVDNGDLYFIKLPDVGNLVEVHWSPGERRFQSVQKFTTKLQVPAGVIQAVISGGDLYLLVKHNASAFLQIYCVRGNSNYTSVTLYETGLHLDLVSSTINVGRNGDLYMIHRTIPGQNSVEVWIATAEYNYKDIQKHATATDEIPLIGERRSLVLSRSRPDLRAIGIKSRISDATATGEAI